MKLKFYFYPLLLLHIAAILLLALLTWRMPGWLPPAGLLIVTGCLLCLICFYRKTVLPLHAIENGMDLLREQDFSSRLSPVGQWEADRIVDIFNRMMQQLKEERLRLREQNHFLDLLINVSPMGVVILTMDGRLSMMNAAALRFLGYTDAEPLEGLKPDELKGPLAEALARIPRNTTETVRPGNSMIYRCSHLTFVDHGFPHPFFLIESLTSEVIKAEKKAYEQVIRMIAHEVNNSTAGITSTLDTVTDALQEMAGTQELCEVMKVCIERCYSMSDFITRFANVVKLPEPTLQPADLNERVIACKRFMESACSNRGIRLHMALCPDRLEVLLDVLLFEQVLVNIIKNAVESIDREGDIYIRTSAAPTTLEIADNGAGITKEVESRLFTPFYSTKPNGQGIGLLVIREVLMKHRCNFSLRTYDDGLTRFRIQF